MRALLVLLALAGTAAADPATVSGEDDTTVTGTMAGLGKNDTLDEHRDLRWTATGDVITIDRDPGGDDPREQVRRSRAFEAKLMRLLGTQTFVADVPVALGPDQLAALAQTDRAITPQRIVVTWAGTDTGVAHYRMFAIFALGSIGITGRVTMAGTFDVDVSRHALVDVRASAVIATNGLLRLDAKASAHLTRRYR